MTAVDINRGTTGVNLPQAVSSEIWASTIDASAVMQVARQIALPGSGISIPMITADAVADWVAETEEKPVSRPTLSNKSMTPYKLAVITPFSNEFRRDLPALYRECARRLPLALGKKFDETVFAASGAPGSNFDQLGGVATLTVDSTGTFGDVAAVVNALAAAGADLSHWVVNPALHGLLLTSVDGFGHQYFVPGDTPGRNVGSVFGAPVVKTRATLPTGSGATADVLGYAGDFAGSAVWGSVEGVQISVSDQATLHDGATTINLWQRNMFALRAEIEVGFRVRDTTHFVRLNDGSAD
jgi:HK97 family phage major capsid protein